MTNRKTTRRALVLSLLSLLVCCSMLVGTTFAWFTDSVTSGSNRIVAGNLDVALYYQNDTVTSWSEVDENTNVFKTGTLWEPGHVEVVKLKVANEGTLVLKYKLGVNVAFEEASINKNNEAFKLSDYIYYAVIDGEQTYSREEAVAAAEKQGAKKLNVETLSDSITLEAPTDTTEAADFVTVVVYMPESVGNEANYGKGQKIPTINLGITLVAAQVEAELDSFDNTYDKEASYPVIEPVNTSNITPGVSSGWGLDEGQPGHFFENQTYTGDAQITVDSNVGVFFKDCKFATDGDMVVREKDPVLYFESCDFTVKPGQYIVTSETTTYQVYFVNCTINGEAMTRDNVAPYLYNIGWCDVVAG